MWAKLMNFSTGLVESKKKPHITYYYSKLATILVKKFLACPYFDMSTSHANILVSNQAAAQSTASHY
jgi:hypothetical protein